MSPEAGAGVRAGGSAGAQAGTYRARAVVDGTVIAETDAAVRVQEVGRPPVLYFPAPSPEVGRRWDAWAGSTAGIEPRQGMVAFDADRVTVEIIDGPDATSKRFPTWGDAADLVDILDVRPSGNGTYVSVTRPGGARSVAEASQILGQCVVAASREAPGRRVVSAHLVMVRVADAETPIELEVAMLSRGRTFSSARVDCRQHGKLCATSTLLLDTTDRDVVRHSAAAPAVAGPLESPHHDMAVTGRDVRMVDGAYTGDPQAPVGPPVIDAWVRFASLPDDPVLHAGVLAQFTGHVSVAAALRPHAGVGQADAHRTISTAINAIAISFHRTVRADQWMLYHHLSTFAGDGMTHAECRVHDIDGDLLASFSVDAMVRPMPDTGGAPRSERSAL